MDIIYFIVITSFCVWLLYRIDVWKSRFTEVSRNRENLIDLLQKKQSELDFTKSTVVGLFNKPVYVSLSSDQVEQIAIMVSNRMKEQPDQWLN